MSLIQQALEKTSRAQETRTSTPVAAPKPWERDPTGTNLEHELIQVQKKYSKQKRFFRGAVVAILFLGVVAGLYYFLTRQDHPKTQASFVTTTIMPQVPVRIFTGITNLGGKAMAVINENIVGVGDVLSGKAVVKEIGTGEVRLDIEGKEIHLKL